MYSRSVSFGENDNQRLQLTGDARDALRSRFSAVPRGRLATEGSYVMPHWQLVLGNGVDLRRLKAEDEAFLWTALYHALHVPPGSPAPSRDVLDDQAVARYVSGWMLREGDCGLLAETSSGPVGAAWLRRWPGNERGYGFVDATTPELSMSVLPDHRQKGLGTRLLRGVLAIADERGDAVGLSVSESNPARRLYEREGFASVGHAQGGSMTMVRDSRA